MTTENYEKILKELREERQKVEKLIEKLQILRESVDSSLKQTKAVTEKDIEARVTDIILELGIPAHLKGYEYLRSSIMLCIKDKDTLRLITKRLYPTIGKMYQTTPSRVERAIRHAIEVAWSRGDIDVLKKYFAYSVSNEKGKPTNNEFIATVTDYLRRNYL